MSSRRINYKPILIILVICLAISGFAFLNHLSKPVEIDISDQMPFKAAIGKKFIVKQDLYIYTLKGGLVCQIGMKKNLSSGRSIGFPKVVDKKYIGLDTKKLVIKGIIEKGQVFTIKRVVKVRGFEYSYISFRVIVNKDPIFSKKECAADFIISIEDRQLNTMLFSEPPIFAPDIAEPDPKDGVWWK